MNKKGPANGVRAVRLSEYESKPVRHLWAPSGKPWVPLGSLTILGGEKDAGKGLFTKWLAARVTRGELDGTFTKPHKVAVAYSEDIPYDTQVKPYIDFLGGNTDKVFGLEDFQVTEEGVNQLAKIIEDNRFIKLVVVDQLLDYLPRGHDEKYIWSDAVRHELLLLHEMAADMSVAVVAVLHAKEHRIRNSKAFMDVPRTVLIMEITSENKRTGTKKGRLSVLHSKGLKPKPRRYRIEVVQGKDGTGTMETQVRLIWFGDMLDDNERKKLGGGHPEWTDLSPGERAGSFLDDVLSNGPVPREEVMKNAKRLNLPEPTVYRTAKAKGVKITRGGFGGGSMWSLPKAKAHAR